MQQFTTNLIIFLYTATNINAKWLFWQYSTIDIRGLYYNFIMKRINNLYQNICNIENITDSFNEVCRNTKNKRKVELLKEYKSIYISRIYFTLMHKSYKVGPYNKFTLFEPKKRIIVSQNVTDKIINHLIARYILYPALLPCLLDINVASRKGMRD